MRIPSGDKQPDSVKEIGKEAFYGCESLREISIPDSVTKIGEGAFKWCRSLREVRIPDSVTGIGWGAFFWCNSSRFIVDPKNRFYESVDGKLVRKKGA